LFAASSKKDYDLAVIGGGVVGVQAALAAASSPYSKKVCLIDAPRESGVLMNEDEDLSIGAPTGLFGKALRDTSKRIKVSTLRGMGLREDRCVGVYVQVILYVCCAYYTILY
jgi:glycine/D-amino acid oxidase-like deaminating enzyme